MDKCNCGKNQMCLNMCDLDIKRSHVSQKIFVSSCGMVFRRKGGNMNRIQAYNNKGFLYVDLYKDGGQRRVSELVLKAFKPDAEWGVSIRYKDDNKKNCFIDNLEWRVKR